MAGTSPAVVLALTAAATSTIRIGSGAVQLGHRTALATVEEFGLIDALHPGRLDLGLGRSGGPAARRQTADAGAAGHSRVVRRLRPPNGLLIPPPFSFERPARLTAVRDAEEAAPAARAPSRRTTPSRSTTSSPCCAARYRSPDGVEAHVVPGEGARRAGLDPRQQRRGERRRSPGATGLRFAANYHVSPATVLEAADGYRAAFQPVGRAGRPYVSVSADVVVAEDEATARELATGYGLWVRSIRTGGGRHPVPDPREARAHAWTDEDRALVADRVDTQFVGSPRQVADQLERLRDATGADELIITTITHDHADRVRSYELLAEEWARR